MTQSEVHAEPLEPDDDTLLTRMKGGDVAAYRTLVDRHLDRVYALALRLLRNDADAQDVAQDCLVKAWTHRQQWSVGRAKFTTWLYRVVVNRCIDHRRVPALANLDDVPEPVDQTEDAFTRIHHQEFMRQVEAAVGSLPPRQRAALTLAYFDDLDNREIAEVLGEPIGVVEGLLKRGRQGLREKLAASG